MKAKRISLHPIIVSLALVALGIPASYGINECLESGPHYTPWFCNASGAPAGSGALSWSSQNFCVGHMVVPPVLTTVPTFSNGSRQETVTYDCTPEQNHIERCPVLYLPGNVYFVTNVAGDPPITGPFNSPGTYTYTAKVDGIPSAISFWWPGQNNANDIVFGTNGILQGNTTYAAGIVGSAFVFDGNGDAVRLGDPPGMHFQNFTFEAWVRRSSLDNVTSVSLQDGLFMSYGQGGFGFGIHSDGRLFLSKMDTTNVTVSAAVTDMGWHHVAVTKSGTVVTFYLDGQSFAAAPFTSVFTYTTPVAIGARGDTFANSFLGLIDEPTVYTCALTANQIQAIYNARSNGKCWTSGGGGCAPIPTGCLCTAVTSTIGTVTITVSGSGTGDPDYDGRTDCEESGDGTDSADPNSVIHTLLGYWRFDNTNTWVGEQGQLPLTAANLTGVPTWNTNGVKVSAGTAALVYRDMESVGGNANINLRAGTISFWFKPDWGSTNAGGVGPQNEARLIEVGSKSAAGGWFAAVVDTTGTNLYFGTQGNSTLTLATNLQGLISWTSNTWHQVVLTYSPINSSLYIDGSPVVTTGAAVANYPIATIRAQGFAIGGSVSAGNQAKGTFDELRTFNYAKDAATVLSDYQAVLNLDSDNDGWPNLVEDSLGTDPNRSTSFPRGIAIEFPVNGSVLSK